MLLDMGCPLAISEYPKGVNLSAIPCEVLGVGVGVRVGVELGPGPWC